MDDSMDAAIIDAVSTVVALVGITTNADATALLLLLLLLLLLRKYGSRDPVAVAKESSPFWYVSFAVATVVSTAHLVFEEDDNNDDGDDTVLAVAAAAA